MVTNARNALIVLAAALVGAGIYASTASASPAAVIRDCSEDGTLEGSYSQDELKGALEQLPSDLDEYTDCRSVIRGAQLASAGAKKRPSAVARKSDRVAERIDRQSPSSPAEQERVAEAVRSGGAVPIDGQDVEPGAAAEPLRASALGTDLPLIVLLLLVGLGAAMLAAGLFALQRRGHVQAEGVQTALRSLGRGVWRGITRFRR